MIRFRMFSTDFRIDFSFFMFTALVFMTNDYRSITMFFLACAVHEMGHLITMCILGAGTKSVFISGLGIRIIQSRDRLISFGRTLVILISGALVNFLIFVSGFFDSQFAFINLMLCIFNLLPFRNLDGGSIIICIGEYFNVGYIVEIFMKIFSAVMILTVFFLVYIYGFPILYAGAVILYYCFSELIS